MRKGHIFTALLLLVAFLVAAPGYLYAILLLSAPMPFAAGQMLQPPDPWPKAFLGVMVLWVLLHLYVMGDLVVRLWGMG